MDNPGVARALAEIADLLEIKGENAFKIRAYRSAADVVRTTADPVSRLSEAQLREQMDIKIFVDTDADIRLIRRIRRDIEVRGRSFQSVRDPRYVVRPQRERITP